MMLSFLGKFFPSKNDRLVKKLTARVAEIMDLCLDPARLNDTPVNEFMDRFVI